MPRRTKICLVTSNKMDKTAVVEVSRFKMHPIYKKRFKISKKFKAHDEGSRCQIGDKVLIEETKPISGSKNWKVIKILEKRQ